MIIETHSQATDPSALPAFQPRNTAYADRIGAGAFPRAAWYAALIDQSAATLSEPAARRRPFPWSERHLHCIWFDPALRPAVLTTSAGERVYVEEPGAWNLEAGPDFIGAALRIGPDRRRISGDVEIHIQPNGWHTHGHASDPRYGNVRLHITYFPAKPDPADFPPGTLHIALKPPLSRQSGFSFEAIDTAAYPYAMRATIPPCSKVFKIYDPDSRILVLKAAGEERLRRKAERIATLIEDHGADQILYEEIMAALGYKHNKRAFRRVAERLPIATLRHESRHQPDRAYALLLGVAGLMPPETHHNGDPETRTFVRSLWDTWWRYREQLADHTAAPIEWRLDGLRPANHPVRRLMAAATLFSSATSPANAWVQAIDTGGRKGVRSVIQTITALQGPYWHNRLTLGGAPQKKSIALIGPQRAAALLSNVLLPYLAATGTDDEKINRLLDVLPAEPDNGIVKQTAYYLFGRDHAPSLYKSELARQGLIQIFQDFCLNDRSRCTHCTFPNLLQDQNRLQNT